MSYIASRPGLTFDQQTITVTRFANSIQEPPSRCYRKGFDYETHDDWCRALKTYGSHGRKNNLQATVFHRCVYIRACQLPSYVRPGYRKFLRYRPRQIRIEHLWSDRHSDLPGNRLDSRHENR